MVLDTWGLMAHLRDEPAAKLVRDGWIGEGAAMCSVNLGEALYMEIRARGADDAGSTIEDARRELTVIDPDWELVVSAATVKAQGGLSYADAFAIATAERLQVALWTGDPEIVDRAEKLPCEVRDLRTAR
jgi:predicted nucleic acid-binding protein